MNPTVLWRGRGVILACAAADGRDQFCQMTIVRLDQTAGVAGNPVRMGPAVLAEVSGDATAGFAGYTLEAHVVTTTKLWLLLKWTDSATSVVAASGAAGSIVNGDTLRIEATVGASEVIIVAKVNNVIVATLIDTLATRLTSGIPGLSNSELGNTSGTTFDVEVRDIEAGTL